MNHTVSNKSIQETNFIETRRKEPGINKSQIKELLRTSLGKVVQSFLIYLSLVFLGYSILEIYKERTPSDH